jgi:hypothetical protein
MVKTVVVSLILLHFLVFCANNVNCSPQFQYYAQPSQYQYGYAQNAYSPPLTVDNRGVGYGVPGNMIYLFCKDCGNIGRKKK